MARQLQIAGTERSDIPPELLKAGEKWLELRKEKRRAAEKAKESKFALIAMMEAHKIPTFRYLDGETKEMKSLSIDLEPKLSVRNAPDEDRHVPDATTASEPSVHPGLIAQAEKAQADANVEETSDGDVTVPETSAPKANKKRRGKAKN